MTVKVISLNPKKNKDLFYLALKNKAFFLDLKYNLRLPSYFKIIKFLSKEDDIFLIEKLIYPEHCRGLELSLIINHKKYNQLSLPKIKRHLNSFICNVYDFENVRSIKKIFKIMLERKCKIQSYEKIFDFHHFNADVKLFKLFCEVAREKPIVDKLGKKLWIVCKTQKTEETERFSLYLESKFPTLKKLSIMA